MIDALEYLFVDHPAAIAAIFLAGAFGLLIGAIPGLTATMAVALFVPFSFHLDPPIALAAIVALEATAIFAGDIPAVLVRIPGTPASAAYADAAYAFTQRGESGRVLGTTLVFSVAGGLAGSLLLLFSAPLLARVATEFSSYEKFWLAVLGLSSAAVITQGAVAKAVFSLFLGLAISTIGLDEIHGLERLTFGIPELAGGISNSFIAAMIGLFGLSEVLRGVLAPDAAASAPAGAGGLQLAAAGARLGRRVLHFVRSSLIGTVIGILPGAGADIAAWISFGASKKLSKRRGADSEASLDALSDATSANNAALAGAWVPALVLGIPGDSVTAIVIGVLMMKDLQPGPRIFENQPTLIYSVYAAFILANLFLLPLGYLAIRAGRRIVALPRRVLLPAILLFCIVGAFAIEGKTFDVGVMLAMGVLGFVLERGAFPVGPVVLGIVLGPMLEHNFMISMINSGGSLLAFFDRRVAGLLGALTLVVWLLPLVLALWRRARAPRPPS
jgi:TctA family transporter